MTTKYRDGGELMAEFIRRHGTTYDVSQQKALLDFMDWLVTMARELAQLEQGSKEK